MLEEQFRLTVRDAGVNYTAISPDPFRTSPDESVSKPDIGALANAKENKGPLRQFQFRNVLGADRNYLSAGQSYVRSIGMGHDHNNAILGFQLSHDRGFVRPLLTAGQES